MTSETAKPGQIEIRRYQPLDRDAVWHLHNAALDDAGANAGDGPWDDDLKNIEAVYIATGGEFLVGIAGGELVAMGALKLVDAATAEIKRMRVMPNRQRSGTGRRILAELEHAARRMNIRRLILDTTTQQSAARAFYEAAGYGVTRRETRGPFELVFYEKTLPAERA